MKKIIISLFVLGASQSLSSDRHYGLKDDVLPIPSQTKYDFGMDLNMQVERPLGNLKYSRNGLSFDKETSNHLNYFKSDYDVCMEILDKDIEKVASKLSVIGVSELDKNALQEVSRILMFTKTYISGRYQNDSGSVNFSVEMALLTNRLVGFVKLEESYSDRFNKRFPNLRPVPGNYTNFNNWSWPLPK